MTAESSAPDSGLDRRPETAVVAAGRPHGPGLPLNVPVVLASNFRAQPGSSSAAAGAAASDPAGAVIADGRGRGARGGTRRAGGGQATAFASGMAAAAAVFDLLPTGARVVALTDCYAGVQALLANAQRLGYWSVELVDVADTAAATAAAGQAGVSRVCPSSPRR